MSLLSLNAEVPALLVDIILAFLVIHLWFEGEGYRRLLLIPGFDLIVLAVVTALDWLQPIPELGELLIVSLGAVAGGWALETMAPRLRNARDKLRKANAND